MAFSPGWSHFSKITCVSGHRSALTALDWLECHWPICSAQQMKATVYLMRIFERSDRIRRQVRPTPSAGRWTLEQKAVGMANGLCLSDNTISSSFLWRFPVFFLVYHSNLFCLFCLFSVPHSLTVTEKDGLSWSSHYFSHLASVTHTAVPGFVWLWFRHVASHIADVVVTLNNLVYLCLVLVGAVCVSGVFFFNVSILMALMTVSDR